MRLIFLGTGTSFGVPQIGCACAVCRSDDPRDKRTRCGAVIEVDGPHGSVRLLIDTPPELRLQLVAAGVASVDAVLYTHEHADHIHGIDDLRAITIHRASPLPLYGEPHTLATLAARFPYVVDPAMRPMPGTTRPEGTPVAITPGVAFDVQGVAVIPFTVPHGRTSVTAYRVGDIGYVTDAKTLPPDALETLAGVRVLVLNALLRHPHPSHLSIAEAIDMARLVGAERTFFTHLTHDNFHAALAEELPTGIAPAHDGLVVHLPERSHS
ncbi:MAG TPA: MBL fold metallo-hydrolase [Gemmatimonas sp.]|uniref:MBL fold metallo-hydrolase n=1 Tax=Gemmatimonas sp. TaxID=1962908 RepID=UPI002ED8BAD6